MRGERKGNERRTNEEDEEEDYENIRRRVRVRVERNEKIKRKSDFWRSRVSISTRRRDFSI